MPQYLILINEDEQRWADTTPDEYASTLAEHKKFMADYQSSLRGGARLRPSNTATSIRRNGNGAQLITDGPFMEAKEALGGFYLVEAENLDAAIEIAKQVPAPFGGVELRPTWPANEP